MRTFDFTKPLFLGDFEGYGKPGWLQYCLFALIYTPCVNFIIEV